MSIFLHFFIVVFLFRIKQRPEFLELRRIEAAREIAHTLAKSNNRVYLNSENLLLGMLGVVGGNDKKY